MKIVKVFLVLSVLLSITGCSPLVNNNPTKVETSSNGSYKALLFVNGMELQSVGHTANESELVVGEFIGAVNEKVDIEIRPSDELTSNYLEEGTEIYSSGREYKNSLSEKRKWRL